MAWTEPNYPAAGGDGVERQFDYAGNSNNASFDAYLKSIDPSTDRAQTGTYSLKHNLNIPGADCAVPISRYPNWGDIPHIVSVSFALGFSAMPTSRLGVLSDGTSTGAKWLTLEPSGEFTIRTFLNLAVATSPFGPNLTGLDEFTVVFDCLSQSTVWVSIARNGVWEWEFDTGLSVAVMFGTGFGPGRRDIYIAESLPTGVMRNCAMYTDDWCGRYTTSVADAPYNLAHPRPRVSVPVVFDANGFHNTWTIGGTTPPANKWQAIDDAPHNEDVDVIQSTVAGDRQTFTYAAANPVPAGATILRTSVAAVQRIVGASKVGGQVLARLGGTSVALGNPANPVTAHPNGWHGIVHWAAARPGGGSWLRADFDPGVLEVGVEALSFGTPLPQITAMRSARAVYYTQNLPLSTTPNQGTPVAESGRADIPGARGPVLRPDYNFTYRSPLERTLAEIRHSTTQRGGA